MKDRKVEQQEQQQLEALLEISLVIQLLVRVVMRLVLARERNHRDLTLDTAHAQVMPKNCMNGEIIYEIQPTTS